METARLRFAEGKKGKGALLILDEAQKITHWSEAVKRLWDEDSALGHPLKVVLLGSSPLLVQKGLTESLAGRFEVIPVTHWSYPEMKEAFGWSLEEYIFFGGYPGAAGHYRRARTLGQVYHRFLDRDHPFPGYPALDPRG